MDSAHAEAAVLLINAGADRSRVRPRNFLPVFFFTIPERWLLQVNYDDETPEEMEGVVSIDKLFRSIFFDCDLRGAPSKSMLGNTSSTRVAKRRA